MQQLLVTIIKLVIPRKKSSAILRSSTIGISRNSYLKLINSVITCQCCCCCFLFNYYYYFLYIWNRSRRKGDIRAQSLFSFCATSLTERGPRQDWEQQNFTLRVRGTKRRVSEHKRFFSMCFIFSIMEC